MDFLKAYPFITIDQYYWGLSVPMIRLMSYDATKVTYLTEKQAKKYKIKRSQAKNGVYEDPKAFAAALGIPVFG